LHHSDIVTYALTRLATEYARDKQETLKNLRRYASDASRDTDSGIIGPNGTPAGYSIRAPKPTNAADDPL
ncbi:MAG: hypothetical protein WBQ94_12045, partial [Terracidiphilus sp.]